jgi:hypothetical protein
MVYLHLTSIKETDSVGIINSMMGQMPLLMPFNAYDISLPISQQAANRCRKLGRPPKNELRKISGSKKRRGASAGKGRR